uniref:Middle domain of initiation factor 4G n=1 Tax=Mimivirus LCMiAC02 TaxID=2506609 RepID=A0A481Z1R5_9VIRU|nr:MAG: middle domain of initiation factor 4G [Mimivirus LCMiAC02]
MSRLSGLSGLSVLSLKEFYSYKPLNLDIHKNLIELCKNNYSNSKTINTSGWRRVNTRAQTWISSNKKEKNSALRTDIRMCLNVINKGNFNKIYNKLKNLKITTRVHMMMLIDQIFTNVVMAPTFVKIYAVLCKNLSSYYIKSRIDGDLIYFRKLFLKKCKITFEILIKLKDEEEIRGTIFKFRENLNNYILFLGELYQKDILMDKVINMIFSKLIGTTTPQKWYQVKLICELMKMVGKKLYSRKYDQITVHFNKLLKIAENKNKKYKMREICLIDDLVCVKNEEQWVKGKNQY